MNQIYDRYIVIMCSLDVKRKAFNIMELKMNSDFKYAAGHLLINDMWAY